MPCAKLLLLTLFQSCTGPGSPRHPLKKRQRMGFLSGEDSLHQSNQCCFSLVILPKQLTCLVCFGFYLYFISCSRLSEYGESYIRLEQIRKSRLTASLSPFKCREEQKSEDSASVLWESEGEGCNVSIDIVCVRVTAAGKDSQKSESDSD